MNKIITLLNTRAHIDALDVLDRPEPLRPHGPQALAIEALVARDDAAALATALEDGLAPSARVGARPLIVLAARSAATHCLQTLLSAGAGVGARDESGYTALHHAALSDWAWGVRRLLEAGADVHAKSHSGLKPARVARPAAARVLGAWSGIELARCENSPAARSAIGPGSLRT